MRVAVLVVAAGRGRRFGDETPKQYLPIAGICSLRRCLETFLAMEEVGVIQTVIHLDDADMYAQALEGVNDQRVLQPTIGGETRVASVTNGLQALREHAPDCVLVHDAARPFVSMAIVRDVISELNVAEAAFVALPVVDALWRANGAVALSSVPRDGLWRAQTPQGFKFQTLVQAHASYQGDAADDVEIVRAMGTEVRIVTGDPANFKITSPGDLQRAEQFLRSR